MAVMLEIVADGRSTLSIGDGAAESIRDLQLQGSVLMGNTSGIITSPEALRTGATNLEIRLTPNSGKLLGRVNATAEKPGTLLPYVLTLSRNR